MKKVISLVLFFVLIFTGYPIYGDNSINFDSKIKPENSCELVNCEKEFDSEGTLKKAIATMKEATYTYEVTDEYIYSIGIYKNGMIDIAVKELSTGLIYSSITSINNIPKSKRVIDDNKFDLIKDSVLNKTIKLDVVDTEKLFKSNRASTSGYKQKVLDELYDNGWTEPYYDYVREQKEKNGVLAELKHSVSYAVVEKDVMTVIAGTSLSLIILYYTWPEVLWKQIASVVVTGGGIYKAIKDFCVADYDVFCYGDKCIYVDNQYQYRSGRTKKWKAIVGDIGVSFDDVYDHYDYNYFDHYELFDIGFDNYFN